MTEKQTQAAFIDFLKADGWATETLRNDFIDLYATKGNDTLIAEVKGHTKSAGTAIDIGYGQLLRRMNFDLKKHRYALVVPTTLQAHVQRVRADIRERLGIELFLVHQDGSIEELRG